MLLLHYTRRWPIRPRSQRRRRDVQLLLQLLLVTCLLSSACAETKDQHTDHAIANDDGQGDGDVVLATSTTTKHNIITNTTTTTLRNSSSHVPLVVSELNLSSIQTNAAGATAAAAVAAIKIATITTNANANAQKVPLRRMANASDFNAGVTLNFAPPLPPPPPSSTSQQQQQQQQTPASIFYANFNNQQNVMQLVRNVDARLRNIRNVEMRVATIQEIFDAMHVSSASGKISHHSADQQSAGTAATPLVDDLQLFSKRLEKKLLKATHIVRELRDFFRLNVSKLMLHHQAYYRDEDDDDDADADADDGDGEENDDDDENDDEMDEFDGEMDNIEDIFLKSYILENTPSYANEKFNYLKTDTKQQQQQQQQQQSHHTSPYLFSNDKTFLRATAKYRLSLQANGYIADKVHHLRGMFTTPPPYNNRDDAPELIFGGGGGGSGSQNQSQRHMTMKLNFVSNNFKHIYFLSRTDSGGSLDGNQEKCNSLSLPSDANFRHLLVAAVQRKYVMLLIDVGSSASSELSELSKAIITSVLQLLSPTDLISLVTVAAEAHNVILDSAHSASGTMGVYWATSDRKDEIRHYIQNLITSKMTTNHTLGFEYAFNMLHALQNTSVLSAQNPIQFLYITRGLLNNMTDATNILNIIGRGQRRLYEPIVINMCVVVVDKKRLLHEEQFLNDITRQNYTKYNVDVSAWLPSDDVQMQKKLIGMFYVMFKVHTGLLLQACTDIFTRYFQKRYLTDALEVHAPVMDTRSKDVIVSVTHDVAPYGVVGVNLYLADLVEDIVNYQQQQRLANNKHVSVYAFLIARNGMTISHPAFPRPSTQQQALYPVDIGYLENTTDFTSIRQRMLHEETGSVNTTIYRRQNNKVEVLNRTFYWQRILGIYVLCLATTSKRTATNANTANGDSKQSTPTALPMLLTQRFGPVKESHMASASQSPYTHMYDFTATEAASELAYHRLDLLPPTNALVCRYFHQVATLDAVTLYLSSAAFELPFTYAHSSRQSAPHTQVRRIEAIMAYVRDTTGVLENPGLRPHIRNEVNALFSAMQHLKRRHQDERGTLKNHIIRRYIATVSGVLEVYPGCMLASNYDPTRRPWFRKALHQPGKIITTSPYLDAGGAGYIITIAHTIFEGKANALHSLERDQPVAIVALDLPYTYFYKLILDTTALCQAEHIKCLLFENEGYLIAHPSMLEVSTSLKNARRPYEHLTHKESYLANDILNHQALVRKWACANYQNRTLQRYYIFNTSLSEILTNVVHGERTKYAISLVRGTNIFAAVLNSTCDGGAFCPCSTIDRTCLNCKRMDQMDCECPCECPMDTHVFDDEVAVHADRRHQRDGAPSNYTLHYSYCEAPSEQFIALPSMTTDYHLLPTCVNSNCDVYGTQVECMAVMGCVWCQQDVDGNGFTASFCAAQTACFNGVLSSLTPYGEFDDDVLMAHGYNPGQKPNSYSAFGPIGGAIVVLALVIGFAIYCYRHNVDAQTQEQFYIDSMQEENYGLPLSRFNFDDCQTHDEPPGGNGGGGGGNGYEHSINLIHPADISPYHMSTGSSYRRPPNGESDHGYSTMTPHEDSSDHQCFTLAEPLLLNDKRHSKSDTLSISTSISTPTNRHHQQHQPHHHHQHHHNPHQNQHHNMYQQQHQHQHYMSGKEARYNLTSPKKYHQPHISSPTAGRMYEHANIAATTTLPLSDGGGNGETATAAPISPRYILAPVTVHRHMETSES